MSMGISKRNLRRFRINPVELAIFSMVTLIFVNSVYKLFYERPAGSLVPMLTKAKAPGSTGLSGRFPASIERRKLEVAPAALLTSEELACEAQQNLKTQAPKIQLGGQLCGSNTPSDTQQLLKTEVVNNANQFHATVFADEKRLKFTTDYIPLIEGSNPIRVDFVYKGGKTISTQVNVSRSPASTAKK